MFFFPLDFVYNNLKHERLEPKSYPIEKENHPPNLNFWVPAVDFPGNNQAGFKVICIYQRNESCSNSHKNTKGVHLENTKGFQLSETL